MLANISVPLISHADAVELALNFWSESASLYRHLVDADSKGSGASAHLQGLHEPSYLDTAMDTSTKSNVLGHLTYSLLPVIIYIA